MASKTERDALLQRTLVDLRDALALAGSPWMAQGKTTHKAGLTRMTINLEPVIEPIAIEKLVPALIAHGFSLGPKRDVNEPGPPVLRATHATTKIELELVLQAKLSGHIKRHLMRQHGPRWLAEFRRAIRRHESGGTSSGARD